MIVARPNHLQFAFDNRLDQALGARLGLRLLKSSLDELNGGDPEIVNFDNWNQ